MVDHPYIFCADPDRTLYHFNVDVEDITTIDAVVDIHLDLHPSSPSPFSGTLPLSILLSSYQYPCPHLARILPLVHRALFLHPHPNISYRTMLELSSTDIRCLFSHAAAVTSAGNSGSDLRTPMLCNIQQ